MQTGRSIEYTIGTVCELPPPPPNKTWRLHAELTLVAQLAGDLGERAVTRVVAHLVDARPKLTWIRCLALVEICEKKHRGN